MLDKKVTKDSLLSELQNQETTKDFWNDVRARVRLFKPPL